MAGTVALDLDQTERDLYATGVYDLATHQAIGRALLVALEACQSYARAAKVWPENSPAMPATVAVALADALKALTTLGAIVSPLPGTTRLLMNIAHAKVIVGGGR